MCHIFLSDVSAIGTKKENAGRLSCLLDCLLTRAGYPLADLLRYLAPPLHSSLYAIHPAKSTYNLRPSNHAIRVFSGGPHQSLLDLD